MELLQKYKELITTEALNLKQKKRINNASRAKTTDDSIMNHSNVWVRGWTKDPKWLNYGIIYNFKNMDDRLDTYKILKDIEIAEGREIYMAGFSLLKPEGNIDTHTDEDFIDESIENVWHFGLDVPNKCSIIIGGIEEKEANGKLIKFRDGIKHSAFNKSNKDRMILYIKFATYEKD